MTESETTAPCPGILLSVVNENGVAIDDQVFTFTVVSSLFEVSTNDLAKDGTVDLLLSA